MIFHEICLPAEDSHEISCRPGVTGVLRVIAAMHLTNSSEIEIAGERCQT